MTRILGGLELVQDALPGQLQPLETAELIHLKRGQARLWFRAALRSFRLLRFDGLALPATSHAGKLYAIASRQHLLQDATNLRCLFRNWTIKSKNVRLVAVKRNLHP